jgi:hypothetical protein
VTRFGPVTHRIVKSDAESAVNESNGNVTLEDVLASEADKNFAGVRSNDVRGVFSVTYNLQKVENNRRASTTPRAAMAPASSLVSRIERLPDCPSIGGMVKKVYGGRP